MHISCGASFIIHNNNKTKYSLLVSHALQLSTIKYVRLIFN